MRLLRVLAVSCLTLLALGLACFASSAFGASGPEWKVLSVSTPTNLLPNSPRDEVQDVTVNATGGTFTLTVGSQSATSETTTPLPYDATAAEVQGALEALGREVRAGGAAVSGGPGASSPYVVTFTGRNANSPIGLMTADSSSLTGGAASATVTEASRGVFVPRMTVNVTNVGGASTDGSTITLSDYLPAGVTATSITGYDTYASGIAFKDGGRAPLSCSSPPVLTCTYSGVVDSGDTLVLGIELAVAEGGFFSGSVNRVVVAGGGAPAGSGEAVVRIGGVPAGFGPAPESVLAAISSSQAGAHPNITTAFTMNTSESELSSGSPKDIRFDLPPGFVGNTVGMPRCSMGAVLNHAACPADTMVGTATVTLNGGGGEFTILTPVYNIAPAPGEPAAFAFDAILLPVRLDTSVISDGDYGVRVTAPDLSEGASVGSTWITIWGVPADHNGPGLNGEKTLFGQSFGGPDSGHTRVALLTNPQTCGHSLTATMSTDAWLNPGRFVSEGASMGALTGCKLLSFSSSFSMLPDTLEAGAPAGYSFDLNVPQSTGPDQLATPNVKDVTLALPVGTVVSPSAAWGLKACSDTQFALHSGLPAACPREAQVGTVRIKTPALEEALEGEVYLGEPECHPCTPEDAADGRMVRLFVNVVGEGESGIVVKLEGHGRIDQATGQITTSFQNNPQLPFSEFKLKLGGGSRAVLANPRMCGPARSSLDLVPWSSPVTPDSTPSYTFEVNQDCFGSRFDPSFVAGTTSIQAGEYTPFTVAFGRQDQDEFLNGIQIQMPPGLLGSLANVPLCREPQASEGTCSGESLIGHTQVLTGPGASPFLVKGGEVFLTEGYKGAPFGLSIVVPAVAGPYTLAGSTGKGTVVVRAAINVDSRTAALTVTSDPLPTALDGIPLQLKVVNVTIDRPGFTFNPSNCGKLQIGATLTSKESAGVTVTEPYQATNCTALHFKPRFLVSTSGKTSKANGASLDAKVIYPTGAQGTEANIHSVKVDLPKQLPSRLTTLQKACTAAVFDSDPASCPAASVVGIARASTPILPVGLTGPVYFVSNGREAFPNLEVILQGYGVRVDLVGDTFISKAGITSSTFTQVPDVPISTFELYLPEGKYSALAANGNLCKSKLAMPTVFTAQNGAEIHQSTKISVTGCAKARKAHTARKASKARRASHGHAGQGRVKR